jgi:copper chaperone CopZ
MRTLVLSITGMSCQHCVEHLSRSLGSTQGVSRVEVDLPSGTARVEHDETLCEPADLITAVRRVGYEVKGFEPAAG